MPSNKISRLMQSRFVRDSGTLLSGNVVAQGISFAAYLALSRLFTPQDFGLYNIFYSYIEVLIILSTCKYELAIVRADTDHEAAQLQQLTLRLNALVSVLLLAVALVLVLLGLHPQKLPSLVVLMIPFMVFFCGTTRVYTFVFNRYKHYPTIATSEVVTSLSGVALKIAMGLLNGMWQLLHTLGMPLGTILGKVAGNAYYRLRLRKLIPSVPDSPHPRMSAGELAKKHRNFPLYAMPKELVSSLSANLPFMWLGIYFDNAMIGLFSLALTFTMRPLGILANGFEKVFYSATTQRVRQGHPLGPDIRRFLLVLNLALIPVVAIGFLYCEPVFTFLFGAKWVGTGYYVRCILPWFWVLLNANSLAFVSNVFSTQRVDFVLQIIQLLLRLAALGVGILRHDFHLAILLFCCVSTLVQLVQLGWYLYQIHRHDNLQFSINN